MLLFLQKLTQYRVYMLNKHFEQQVSWDLVKFKVEEGRTAYNPTTSTIAARYTSGEDLQYPVLEQTSTDIMNAVNYIYDRSALPTDFSQWFEVHRV